MSDYGDFENKVEGVGNKVWSFIKTNVFPLLVGFVVGVLFGLTL